MPYSIAFFFFTFLLLLAINTPCRPFCFFLEIHLNSLSRLLFTLSVYSMCIVASTHWAHFGRVYLYKITTITIIQGGNICIHKPHVRRRQSLRNTVVDQWKNDAELVQGFFVILITFHHKKTFDGTAANP